MKNAAITVSHNDGENLIKLINAIRNYDCLDYIIVVDNKSDELPDLTGLIESQEKLILIPAEKNGGYGYGNNIGLKKAAELGCEKAIICNPDTEWSEDTANALFETLENDVAVCSCICKAPESSYEAPKSGWAIRPWHLELFEHGPVSRRLWRGAISKADKEISAVHGSLLAVDIAKVLDAGGYDDNVFLYCEENILGYKIKQRGYRTVLRNDCSYFHNHKPAAPSVKNVKILKDSLIYYFERYLCLSPFDLCFAKLFMDFVVLETKLHSKSHQ